MNREQQHIDQKRQALIDFYNKTSEFLNLDQQAQLEKKLNDDLESEINMSPMLHKTGCKVGEIM